VRVLFVISSLGRGGAEKQLYLLLKYLDRERFAPSVASLSTGGLWARRIRALGVPVTELPRRHGVELSRLGALHRLVRRDGPHVLQTFSPYDTAYGFPVGWVNRVPVLIASRRTESDLYPGLGWAAGRVSRLLSRWADAIICNSDQPRRRAPRGLLARHVVIHNGVEPLRPIRPRDDVRRALGLPETAPVVGSVGRLVTAKNYPLMIQVALDVLRTHPATTFLLVGGGEMETELRVRIRRAGLERNVWLMGERDDVTELMSAFDVFLLTSNREGLPNAVMEAMALGLPCVVTNAGGSAELVAHGETGYVCALGDQHGLAEGVGRLLDDPAARARLGANGRTRMASEFSPDRMATATGALYSRLLSGKRAPAVSAAPGVVGGSLSR
jgi:glycosyltransferase involved in cell wall biosynthesis